MIGTRLNVRGNRHRRASEATGHAASPQGWWGLQCLKAGATTHVSPSNGPGAQYPSQPVVLCGNLEEVRSPSLRMPLLETQSRYPCLHQQKCVDHSETNAGKHPDLPAAPRSRLTVS